MIPDQELSELKHDAESACDIGKTCVVRVNCETLLALVDEIQSQRAKAILYERYQLQASAVLNKGERT